MERINASIDFDRRLYAHDIAASRAHCNMLIAQEIIPEDDGHKILKGLDQIEDEIARGEFAFTPALEDIHMHVEARLTEIVGEAGGRLHTARSRNDQVATDFRLWVRDAVDDTRDVLKALQEVLLMRAEEHAATVMPGFTHLQSAQPVTLGHHLMAYFEMFERDRSRLSDCRKRLNLSPLGAGALAGTSIPIDRNATADALGFDGPSRNSMDAVADRDFAVEFLASLSLCAVHLSRLAEEIVIWSTSQFGFITLPDTLATGSSMMPQKKNPDAAELVRGKVGRIVGAVNALLILMKGLPMTYSKDMQEDKEPTFDAVDSISLCIAAVTAMIAEMTVNTEPMEEAAGQGYATATDLADWLVKELALPFRQAHQVTAQIVRIAESGNLALEDVPLGEMQKIEPRITSAVLDVLSVRQSIESRTSLGGTSPARVREAISEARKRLAES
tara:strand:+ start:520 stop:1854 length:1335 start_codon:yes stop_codon:yes gene_type:complete